MTTSNRLALPADRDFIVSGWSSSYRLSDRAGMIAMSRWADTMHREIDDVLARPSASTVTAYDTDSGVFQGFICADRNPGPPISDLITSGLPIVFYVYVKEAYRREGVARGLFASVGIDPMLPFTYACRTPIVGLLRDKIPFAKHDHLRARFPEGARP